VRIAGEVMPANPRPNVNPSGDGPGAERQAEGGGNGDRHEARIAEWAQLDQPDAVGKARQESTGDLDLQPGLADVSGAGQRQQPMLGGEFLTAFSASFRPTSSGRFAERFVGGAERAATELDRPPIGKEFAPVRSPFGFFILGRG